MAIKDKKKFETVDIGDSLVFYVKQVRNKKTNGPWINGIYVSTSKPFFDTAKVFSSSIYEVFPWRIPIKPKLLPKRPLEFKTLVTNLQFITNKVNWRAHLQGAMRRIPKEDFEFIYSQCKKP